MMSYALRLHKYSLIIQRGCVVSEFRLQSLKREREIM